MTFANSDIKQVNRPPPVFQPSGIQGALRHLVALRMCSGWAGIGCRADTCCWSEGARFHSPDSDRYLCDSRQRAR
jgi:hypothetical protein